ncbi:fatty acid-binding protein, brain [Plakobranchus ocellatus]|uniref:Fatty acid-binding protein, brain n=1 Tax=Plakobranchus ocellatus TaxID=259542 RepID=A0AAV4DDZ7_9GAST|nr:fatty acid-binding protein, brain [Plakobranchus ocellatus]
MTDSLSKAALLTAIEEVLTDGMPEAASVDGVEVLTDGMSKAALLSDVVKALTDGMSEATSLVDGVEVLTETSPVERETVLNDDMSKAASHVDGVEVLTEGMPYAASHVDVVEVLTEGMPYAASPVERETVLNDDMSKAASHVDGVEVLTEGIAHDQIQVYRKREVVLTFTKEGDKFTMTEVVTNDPNKLSASFTYELGKEIEAKDIDGFPKKMLVNWDGSKFQEVYTYKDSTPIHCVRQVDGGIMKMSVTANNITASDEWEKC